MERASDFTCNHAFASSSQRIFVAGSSKRWVDSKDTFFVD
jgi:hypothetical protein